ncbi:P-loop containing nucleoside triphosphate hydrolase protein [Ilyonectria robusta]|uniref:P-loop containing nucleoside triphosphate hydrolase protein n=1 Tax=Ilyonectria robusta TaxID=1079257 RepID=UPI001E8EE7D8|nr:P-loop containing nucleoside triphosphate hydrolase protein [Ilyonectria robusta]KAH8679494.1 P-loop containing nucleoside triphosphate hydrolase protein [Ilyonectria robusta]
MDLVRGKGRGLIILLHGPPGVGKTSTAETIAAYSRRPLYPLTCGDIGLTPEQVEFNLNYHFGLASQWGCIMLNDEADVFLMKRDWRDINRNALVSLFLRVLEYYSGILPLTTNRTGVIDEAFKSRMHLYLRYPSIDLDSTKKIWDRLLDRIMRDNKESDVKIDLEQFYSQPDWEINIPLIREQNIDVSKLSRATR